MLLCQDVSTSLLKAMNREQALAISREQMSDMSTETMNAIYYAQDGFNGDTAYVVQDEDANGDGTGSIDVVLLALPGQSNQ